MDALLLDYLPILIFLGLAAAIGLGFMLANFLMASVALPRILSGDALVSTLFNIGLWIAALFFQVQEK